MSVEHNYHNQSEETNKYSYQNDSYDYDNKPSKRSEHGDIITDGIKNEPPLPCWKLGCLPAWFRREIIVVLSLACPMILTTLFNFLMGPISLIFCGRLGAQKLGGVALANTIINVLGFAVGMGLGTALDTLVSNTYGSSNKLLIGTYVQRGIIILSLAAIPCWVIHLNITPLLVLIGQDRAVSIVAGDYILLFLPGIFFNYMYQVLCKYLYNQGIIFPTIGFGVVGAIVNVVAHVILVTVWELGTDGSALAQVAAYFSMDVTALVYIFWSKVYKDSWAGWSMDCLHDWGSFCSLALPGMVMIFVEWGSFEVGTILTGLLSVIELDAQTIVFQIETIMYMVPLGFSIAVNIRVGQFLGAGDSLLAKRTSQACIAMVYFTLMLMPGCAALVVSILLASLRLELPKIFTNESGVITSAGNILPIVAGYMIFDSVAVVIAGILRGCGRQKIGAFFIIIGYVVIALPIGISLMFTTQLRSQGIWFGLTIGIAIETISFVCLFFKTNWDDQARMAQERAGLGDMVPSLPILGTYDEEILPLSDTDLYTSFTDYSSTDEISGSDACRPKWRRQKRTKICFSAPRATSQQDLKADFPNAVSHSKRLTSKEVIFRRSITLLILLMLLAFGVYMRFIFAIERCIPLPANFNETTFNNTEKLLFPYCNSSVISVTSTISPFKES